MITNLKDALSLTLSTNFPEAEVYTENPEQGLSEPCFLITLVNPSNEHFINNRYKRKNLFVVQYFPKSNELDTVLESLYLDLERISDLEGETYTGSQMRAEIRDNVLHFFVHYDMFVHKFEEIGELMGDIDVNNTARS